MRKLAVVPATTTVEVEVPLPLVGVLGEVRDRFFALCVSTGKQVLRAMMEHDRERLCGPRGMPNPGRRGYRHGATKSGIVLGGRQVTIARPRVRSIEREEMELASYRFAADRDPLDWRTMEAIALGVSTRKYARSLDTLPGGETEGLVSSSSVSRRFVAMSAKLLGEWMSVRLEKLDVVAVMIDGVVFRGRTILVALGVAKDGHKHVLGLHEGSTENAVVAKALLADLVERGLSQESPLLFVIDGSKALRRAIREVFGEGAVVQRCQVHKKRNVLGHLPDEAHASVGRAMAQAYESKDEALARRQLEGLVRSLEREHPGAAASLREGLDETLTLQRLGIGGALYRTLRSTNAIENLNGSIAHFTRNVRRWRDGKMVLRWVGASLHHAKQRFRRIRGHDDLAELVRALKASSSTTSKTVDDRKKVA